MIDRKVAHVTAEEYCRRYWRRYRCTIDDLVEYETHWVVVHSAESLDYPDSARIRLLRFIIDKSTGLCYAPRGARTQTSDIEEFPGNRERLYPIDLRKPDDDPIS